MSLDTTTHGALPSALAPVVRELDPVMEPWELAQWFASPNAWLAGGVPADLLATRPGDVLDAARGDRFILAG